MPYHGTPVIEINVMFGNERAPKPLPLSVINLLQLSNCSFVEMALDAQSRRKDHGKGNDAKIMSITVARRCRRIPPMESVSVIFLCG